MEAILGGLSGDAQHAARRRAGGGLSDGRGPLPPSPTTGGAPILDGGEGTKIGRWPAAEVAVKLRESLAYMGGRLDRGAPCYGEDNHYVYGELLGMSSEEIAALAEEGVI